MSAVTRLVRLAALAGAAAAAGGCGTGGPQDITGAAPVAQIKFFNFGVGAPSVNFYGNAVKLTAVSSTACAPPADTTAACRTTGVQAAAGTASGAAAAGGFYASITPGPYTLAGQSAVPADSGRTIASVATTIAAGAYYSYYVSGIYTAAARTADAFVLRDSLPATVDQTVALVRFVHAISNAGALTLSFRDPATLREYQTLPAASYKGATGFTVVAPPSTSSIAAVDFVVRTAGATAPTAVRTNVSLSPGRIYTVTARGDITSTTSASRPQLDFTPNY